MCRGLIEVRVQSMMSAESNVMVIVTSVLVPTPVVAITLSEVDSKY